MPKRAAPKAETSLALGKQARQLLALMAEKSGMSLTSVLESAILEKAQHERVALPLQAEGNGAEAEIAARSAIPESTPVDLRPLAGLAVAGDAAALAEIKQVIAERRTMATVAAAKRPEELDPRWQDRFVALVERLQRAVPEEWTEEELDEQIAQAIAEVRANRAGDD